MTTHDALLAAVLAKPEDDLPRLVYADYLEENGESERAEFIRVQVESPVTPPSTTRKAELDNREQALFGPVTESVFLRRDSVFFDLMQYDGTRINPRLFVRRGFLAEIHCTLAEWCGGECQSCHGRGGYENNRYMQWDTCPQCTGEGRTTGIGPAVVRSHPVEVVRLTDREPAHLVHAPTGETSWWWFHPERMPRRMAEFSFRIGDNRGQSSIPEQVLRHIVNPAFQNADDASAALSAALITWAKSQPHPARITTSAVSVDVTT